MACFTSTRCCGNSWPAEPPRSSMRQAVPVRGGSGPSRGRRLFPILPPENPGGLRRRGSVADTVAARLQKIDRLEGTHGEALRRRCFSAIAQVSPASSRRPRGPHESSQRGGRWSEQRLAARARRPCASDAAVFVKSAPRQDITLSDHFHSARTTRRLLNHT